MPARLLPWKGVSHNPVSVSLLCLPGLWLPVSGEPESGLASQLISLTSAAVIKRPDVRNCGVRICASFSGDTSIVYQSEAAVWG